MGVMTTEARALTAQKTTPARALTAKKKPVPAPAKVALSIVGLAQIALALAAFSDLWARRADEVRMSKPAWIPIILINWIGPLAYFIGGVKR